jgi:hypothetical protein
MRRRCHAWDALNILIRDGDKYMTLKAVVDNLDNVDEQHRSLYQPERDSEGKETGKHIVAIEPVNGYNLENIESLKGALSNTRTERDDIAKKLKNFEGIDPKKYKALETKVEELQTTDAETEDRVNKIVESQTKAKLEEAAARLEQANTEFQSQLDTSKTESEQLRNSLKQVLVSDRAKAMAESISDAPQLLAPLIERNMKCVIDEKGPRVQFVDDNGTVRIGKDIHNDMSESEFIEDMKKNDKFAPLIRSDQRPGTDPKAPGGGTQKIQGSTTYDPKASRQERVAAIKARQSA